MFNFDVDIRQFFLLTINKILQLEITLVTLLSISQLWRTRRKSSGEAFLYMLALLHKSVITQLIFLVLFLILTSQRLVLHKVTYFVSNDGN